MNILAYTDATAKSRIFKFNAKDKLCNSLILLKTFNLTLPAKIIFCRHIYTPSKKLHPAG
jgi:hypothetical protein